MTDQSFSMKRRAALKAIGLGAAATAMSAPPRSDDVGAIFQHGVASGDPLQDRVILWTRVTPADLPASAAIAVVWEVKDSSGSVIVSGETATDGNRDYTVKVDAKGLDPNTVYTYRFYVGDMGSAIGTTKTLPVGDVSAITLAACSCSNYPYGFFNVYREMAKNQDIDLVVHLGDYIYEYALNTYSSKEIEAAGRTVLPEREIVSLKDYRQRYARYRTDPDLQAVHAAHPFLMIWDDHEFSNDAWQNGAENHQSDKEGAWAERRDAALKAYEEWTPTRANMAAPWRSFDFGNLARLMLLDTRLWGRDKQLNYAKDFDLQSVEFDVSDPETPILLTGRGAANPASMRERHPLVFDLRSKPPKPITDYETLSQYDAKTAPPYLKPLPDISAFKKRLNDPARSLLGKDQEEWLKEAMFASKLKGQTWQILGQQVLMGQIAIPNNIASFVKDQTGYIADGVRALAQLAGYGLPLNMDAWDGYPAARDRVLSHARNNANNLVILAGDTHNAWLNELTVLDEDKAVQVGYEFATASVSSPGFDGYFPADTDIIEEGFLNASPTLKWMDAKHRGYATLSLTPKHIDVTFHRVSTVKARDYDVIEPRRFRLNAASQIGENTLETLG